MARSLHATSSTFLRLPKRSPTRISIPSGERWLAVFKRFRPGNSPHFSLPHTSSSMTTLTGRDVGFFHLRQSVRPLSTLLKDWEPLSESHHLRSFRSCPSFASPSFVQ